MPSLQPASRVLVTGGAGYIGSHVVQRLAKSGREVVVYDNLCSGHRWAVPDAELVVGDLGDRHQLEALLSTRTFDAVLHFAAHIWVGESVTNPGKYYFNNTSNALRLFDLCAQYGIHKVVFSSTAAVYGQPDVEVIDETTPLVPINPYGASKMMSERVLRDIAAAAGMRYAIFRYFNVAGADPDGRIGQATPNATHLIKVACEAALGLRERMSVNGTDYPTPDGTCVRDYIHVEDLARAHVAALGYLDDGGASTILNCGYGKGFSVREVLDAVRRTTSVEFPIDEGPRRAGDPARLIAGNDKIRKVLGWEPEFDDLDTIIDDAWRWEQKLQEMKARIAA